MIDFDMMLVHVGEFGIYQKGLFIFQAPFCMFVQFLIFGQIFIYLYPRVYWCSTDPCINGTGLTPEQSRNLSVPYSIQDGDWNPCLTFSNTADIERTVNSAETECRRITNGDPLVPCDYNVDLSRAILTRRIRSAYDEYDDRRGYGYGNRYPPKPDKDISSTTNNYYYSEDEHEPTVSGTSWRPATVRPTTGRPTGRPATRRPTTRPKDTNTERSSGPITTSRPNTATSRSAARESPIRTCTGQLRTLILGPNVSINAEGIANRSMRVSRQQNGREWATRQCDNWTWAPDQLRYPTIVSEERWWCDPETWITTANAMFYVGAIVGGVVIGYIADSRGRVPALVAANVLGCIGGVLSALFYRNYALFLFFRFITGLAFDNCFSMIYILVLEYVGPTYRTLAANLSIAIFYTIGGLIIPWVALGIGNWSIFTIVLSVPMLLGILAYFFVPESARWLLSKGRGKEATKILRRFAKVNRKEVDEKIFVEFESDAQKMYDEFVEDAEEASLWAAFKRPRILRNFLLLTAIWASIALVYDAHSRNILNLGSDVFISFTIAASTEFPADILLIFTLDRFGRRWIAFGSLCLSGAFSLGAAFVPAGNMTASLVMAMISRFFVNISVNAGLQWVAELLPTVIRAQGVNAIHIMGYVVSIFSPFIASLGRTNAALSLTLLGVISCGAGALCLFLPETLGEDLPNTLEEGEVFGTNQSFWNCPFLTKPKSEEAEAIERPEMAVVQRRNMMRPPLRGESFRSSIISSSSSGRSRTPSDLLMMHPGAGADTEKSRLKRVHTK